METTYTAEKQEKTNTFEMAAEAIFSKLDEAIDDVENGRVISSDELWKELSDV